MSIEKENLLNPFSENEIISGIEFPEKISSLVFDVEAGEKLKLEFVLERLDDLIDTIKKKTNKKFVVFGSMAMYALLNELRGGGKELMVLEQRIAGGKNDCDIGVLKDDFQGIMDDFHWDEKNKIIHRGKVGNNKQTVDLHVVKKELYSLPWIKIKLKNADFYIQSPEEIIFSKIIALIDKDDNYEKEIKWGIDMKLIQAYLMIKNNWDEKILNRHLSNKWNEYLDDYFGEYLMKETGNEKINFDEAFKNANNEYLKLFKKQKI